MCAIQYTRYYCMSFNIYISSCREINRRYTWKNITGLTLINGVPYSQYDYENQGDKFHEGEAGYHPRRPLYTVNVQ